MTSPVDSLRRWIDDHRSELEKQGYEIDYLEQPAVSDVVRTGQIDLDHGDWLSRCFLADTGSGWVQYGHTEDAVIHEAVITVTTEREVLDVMTKLVEIVSTDGTVPPQSFS